PPTAGWTGSGWWRRRSPRSAGPVRRSSSPTGLPRLPAGWTSVAISYEHYFAADVAGLDLPVRLRRAGQRKAPPDRQTQHPAGGEGGESGQGRGRAGTAEPVNPVPGGGVLVH